MSLLAKVTHTIIQQNLFKPGDSLIVALSGGADSTALLDLLAHLPDFNLKLIVAHLNHGLRGAESDADEEFCRTLAETYALPFATQRVDVKKMAQVRRLNLEDAGRRARIEFFDALSIRQGAAAVVLAHHADDQAETVLMRLLRGSGMSGLSGMPYRNDRGYLRPLLDVPRAEIEQYLHDRDLHWREDASNRDTAFLRNRIRHQLLPLLEEYNPCVRSTLATTASLLAGDEDLLEELTGEAFSKACCMEEGRVVCTLGPLRSLKAALLKRVLRHAITALTGTLAGVSLRHIDAISALIDSDRPNSRVTLPEGITAVREYDRLLLQLNDRIWLDSDFELLIPEPGEYHLPIGGTISVELISSAAFPITSDAACFDLVKTPFPWVVRTFRPGDRIVPFGMKGRKKVKNIFIDQKIPVSERKIIPLLFSGDNLIWVAGMCASELCRTDDASVTLVRVVWSKNFQ
jgi:tRNA(Ile)-lysidine synthase